MVARTPGGREAASSILVPPTSVCVCQGVAQLVARSVRDAEVVGSSPITLTIFMRKNWQRPALRERDAEVALKSDHPDHFCVLELAAPRASRTGR